ncbi:MAG: hypothetical protein GXP27_00855 [Planctomycetes bacterium]|nr:hypothetical protein [Planctomycetota bacterium]
METLRMLLKLVDFVASALGAIVLVLFFWAGFYWATHPIPTTEEYYQQGLWGPGGVGEGGAGTGGSAADGPDRSRRRNRSW